MTVKEFTVDRATWACGAHPGGTSLLGDDGFRCCLGFLGQASGLSNEELIGFGEPDMTSRPNAWPESIVNAHECNTGQCDRIMKVNDRMDLANRVRESKLRDLFAKIGIKIKFKGRYPNDR